MIQVVVLLSAAVLLGGCSAVTRNLGIDTPTVPVGPEGLTGAKVGCVHATPTAGASTASPAAVDGPIHQIGETVTLGTMAVTVNGAYCPEGFPGAMPEPGNQFIVVEFTIANNGTSGRTLSSKLQTRLRDATGQEYGNDARALAISGGAPFDGVIPAGIQRTSRAAFQAPIDAPDLVFLFSSHPFSDEGVAYFDVRP